MFQQQKIHLAKRKRNGQTTDGVDQNIVSSRTMDVLTAKTPFGKEENERANQNRGTAANADSFTVNGKEHCVDTVQPVRNDEVSREKT
jgi:hypothetical protein